MTKWRVFLLCFLVHLCWAPVGEAGTYTEADTLLTSLLSSYNNNLVPLNDQSATLELNINIILMAVTDMDTIGGIMETVAALSVEWTDEKLQWDPSTNGYISTLSILQNQVWIPPLVVSNNNKLKVFGHSSSFVIVQANGLVSMVQADKLETICNFNMKFWPFDKQVCEIKVTIMGFSSNEVVMKINGITTDTYTENGEWALEEKLYYNTSLYGQSESVFILKFRRLPTFYILTILLPLLGVTCMNGLVFLLPSESGERVGFSITILLSITVFLTIISTEIPKTANPVSLMSIYIMVVMAISSFSTSAVMFSLAIYHRCDKIPISKIYRQIVKVNKSLSSVCKRKVEPESSVSQASSSTSIMEIGDFEKSNIQKSEKEAEDNRVDSSSVEDDLTWQEVSVAVDKMMFLLISIGTFVSSVVLLCYVALASDYPN